VFYHSSSPLDFFRRLLHYLDNHPSPPPPVDLL